MREISWLAEYLLVSQEGLYNLQCVGWIVGWFFGRLDDQLLSERGPGSGPTTSFTISCWCSRPTIWNCVQKNPQRLLNFSQRNHCHSSFFILYIIICSIVYPFIIYVGNQCKKCVRKYTLMAHNIINNTWTTHRTNLNYFVDRRYFRRFWYGVFRHNTTPPNKVTY
jgi:hypothetical protein